MSAIAGGDWWNSLRLFQRERIDSLTVAIGQPDCAIHPSGLGNVRAWLNGARAAWCECDTPEVERCLRVAAEIFIQETKWAAESGAGAFRQ
jgi:hypothetical protein